MEKLFLHHATLSFSLSVPYRTYWASILFIFAVHFSSLAQAPERFVQNYHFPPNFDSQSYGVANTDYGYMLAGMSIDTVGNPGAYWAFTVSGHDHLGNLLWYKRHQMSPNETALSSYYIHDFLKQIDGYYYSTFNVHDTLTNAYSSYLLKLDNQGDTIWTKHYLGDAQDSIVETKSINKSKDGGFILSGLTYSNGNKKTFILKTDIFGNALWKNKYNLSLGEECVFNAVQDSATKKIVMVGYKNTYNTSFVCILDSLGNMLLEKNFTPNGGYLHYVRQLSDGDFIAVGAEMTGNILGGYNLTKPMTLRFNIYGDLLWKNLSGYESIDNTFLSFSVENGDTIVAVGYEDTLFTQNLGINRILSIRKISPSGVQIWGRMTDVFSNSFNGVFQAIVKTEDGGYATTGCDFMAASPNSFVLIKLDEWGCLSGGCQTAGVDENATENEVTIFPNPAGETLTISLPENALNTDCLLFDNLGKEVLRIDVLGGENLLDIKMLESGMYTVKVNTQTIKFIKN